MSRLVIVFVLLALALGLLTIGAGTATAQEYPNVASLKPFSAEANWMSLAGYLRWQVFLDTGEWITADEAVRAVNEQLGTM
jgi:hypothetical protein